MAEKEEELLTVIEDDEPAVPGEHGTRWKVAVIDDDPAVHDGTRFALYDYILNGQKLEIISAHSAAEGRELLRAHRDIAVVLLDVVMESEHAGLDLVEFIRKELKNETVRIILRTGQPGQAPERRVIVDYDINDYKAKTELTADKLFTSLTAALRSYQQLERLVETRRGLEIIIEAASTLFDFRSMQRLAEGVLTQIASLLNADCAGILVLRDEGGGGESFSVLAGSGCYSLFTGVRAIDQLDPELRLFVQDAFGRRKNEFLPRRSTLYMKTASGREVLVLVECSKHLSDTDRALVEVFCSRLSIAFDNVILYEQLQQANTTLEKRVAARTRELTAANRRLGAQWERLRRANAFKSEILGKVAHDLKNPLGVIMGRSEMLTDMTATNQAAPEAVGTQAKHIRESAQRLLDMVDSLLADAMADALDISIRREPVDMSVLVGEIVDASRPLVDKKKQAIDVTVAGKLVVSGDYDRLREAIDNLVSNAVKYNPTGGRIEVSAARAGNDVVIRVSDHGPGMSPDDMSRVFGRFQRLSAKPTAGESSTGLGLSIAKRIVELHGGRIVADSPGPGRGTAFTISLPLQADAGGP
jgi:signal transduction histidine kinase/DNA-binding NarL/FixJ family response regulator